MKNILLLIAFIIPCVFYSCDKDDEIYNPIANTTWASDGTSIEDEMYINWSYMNPDGGRCKTVYVFRQSDCYNYVQNIRTGRILVESDWWPYRIERREGRYDRIMIADGVQDILYITPENTLIKNDLRPDRNILTLYKQ